MNLPEKFASYTRHLFGDELWLRYLSSFNEPTPVSIRLNSGTSVEQLEHLPIESPIPWSSRGYYLSERPQFTLDPLLHAGAYYVQEASSQYLDEVLRELEILKSRDSESTESRDSDSTESRSFWLDLCAAPGGKSLILKDYLPAGTTLISNEYVRKRAWILAENIAKSKAENIKAENIKAENIKAENIIVCNNSAEEIASCGLTFDLILTDVPCSGEGMFRKDHATIEEWSEDNVQKCAALQREIVTHAWQCLSPGGILIYSTCTFNEYEDEQNAQFIQERLGGKPVFPARKFIPGEDRGEGQFMTAFRKEGTPTRTTKKDKKADKKIAKALSRLNIIQLPQDIKGEPQTPECELTLEQALDYLRGQSLTLLPETPRGIVAATYKGFRLGLMKNIGSRANNLYPAEWRIKHL